MRHGGRGRGRRIKTDRCRDLRSAASVGKEKVVGNDAYSIGPRAVLLIYLLKSYKIGIFVDIRKWRPWAFDNRIQNARGLQLMIKVYEDLNLGFFLGFFEDFFGFFLSRLNSFFLFCN